MPNLELAIDSSTLVLASDEYRPGYWKLTCRGRIVVDNSVLSSFASDESLAALPVTVTFETFEDRNLDEQIRAIFVYQPYEVGSGFINEPALHLYLRTTSSDLARLESAIVNGSRISLIGIDLGDSDLASSKLVPTLGSLRKAAVTSYWLTISA